MSQVPYWKLNGNPLLGIDGVNATNNFLGTSAGNANSLRFGINGTTNMTLQNGTGFFGIGLAAPAFRLDVQDNGKTIESKKMVKNQ